MAVMGMRRINICAMRKDRKALLERLQTLGTVVPDIDLPEDYEYDTVDVASSRQLFEKQIMRSEQALEILDEYAPIKKPSSFAGRELKSTSDLKDAEKRRNDIADVISVILDLKRKIDDSRSDIVRLMTQGETLTPWLSLDIPAGFKGTRNTAFITGTVPAAMTEDGIIQCVSEKSPEVRALHLKTLYSDQDFIYFTLVCMKKDSEAVESALRERGFTRSTLSGDRTPAQMKEDYEKQIALDEKQVLELSDSVAIYSDKRPDIMLLRDYYAARAGKYELLGTLPETENTFAISGYVTDVDADRTVEDIRKHFSAAVELEDLKEEEQAPVKLCNNKFSANFEGITSSFGLPHKGEVDPTFIMSFFYVFFFGLMLSDAAYGAILSIATFILIKKFPRMEEGMKKLLVLFFFGGLSTLFWGIMFGGYFGDAFDTIYYKLILGQQELGDPVIPAAWFVPLNNPMYLLDWCMLFGVIHLFTGHGIKGYMYLKDKNIKGFIFEVMGWYVLLIGLLLMLLPSELFKSISGLDLSFPDALNSAAPVLAIIGVIMLVINGVLTNDNPALGAGLGLYDVYNITGWLSDVLSYSRLLALGLATGVIASVVNMMGSMIKGPVGVIVFIIVFILGHILNIAINLLGAYVHTCRLQYVEFFGKFYEGGGLPFRPFMQDTKYYEFKEETN